jgi:S1-C subfamily serine protease
MTMPQFPTRSLLGVTFSAKARFSALNRGLFGVAGRPLGAALIACSLACGPPSWPGGIHAVLAASPRGVRVVEIPVGSPAMQSGLVPGDFILAIDGHPVADLPPAKLRALLSGEVGSSVLLRIDRGGVMREVSVQRAPYRRAERRSGT